MIKLTMPVIVEGKYDKIKLSNFIDGVIIETDGLIVTEFDYNMKPLKENFPKRNRIVTALSEGILVVEAGYRSGSSITAKNAIEQEKLVFAFPGILDSKVGVGVNNLIKNGAILTTEIEDILKRYPQFANRLRIGTNKKSTKSEKVKKEFREIYSLIKKGINDIDSIIENTGIGIKTLLTKLTNMEIEDLIEQDANGKYKIK